MYLVWQYSERVNRIIKVGSFDSDGVVSGNSVCEDSNGNHHGFMESAPCQTNEMSFYMSLVDNCSGWLHCHNTVKLLQSNFHCVSLFPDENSTMQNQQNLNIHYED